MMHAENGIAIDVLVEQALAAGRTDPRYHGEVRHALLEAEATHRAIQLARVAGAPLYVVHVSATEAVAELAQARDRGLPSSARPARSTSSCPPTTSPSRTSRAPSTSAPRRCGPKEHQATSGAACAPTTCRWSPPTTAPSASRARRSSAAATSRRSRTACRASRTAWTCSTRRVVDGHISRRRWVEIACATPARMFGLYPRKGTIAPGADADIVDLRPGRRAGRCPPRPTT